jgi:hypothetical protein
MTIEQALEAVYASLDNDNENIDECIDALKAVLKTNGAASITVDANRLPQNNRQGRKMMQSYFKRRGVVVVFA